MTAVDRPLIALHLSPVARRLLAAAPATVEAIKLGPWAGRDEIAALAQERPLLLHSLGLILSADAPEPRGGWAAADDLIRLTRTPWVSEHLGFAAREVAIRWSAGTVTVDASGPLTAEAARERITRNLVALRERLSVPVLAENLDYVPNPAYAHVTRPEFVRAVIEDAGVGLLLDVAHARIAADWLGLSSRDYLARLPLDRAVEWHVNGPRPRPDGRLWDAHASLLEEDLELLAWLRPRCPILRAVTLEYEGEDADRELARLRDVLSS